MSSEITSFDGEKRMWDCTCGAMWTTPPHWMFCPYCGKDQVALTALAAGFMVAGDSMEISGAAFLQRAEVLLADEQEKPLPDNALIDFICQAVRLWREYERAITQPIASRPVDPVEGVRRAIEFGIKYVLDEKWSSPVGDEDVECVWKLWLVEREAHE